jgi:hypothetical protein
MLAALQATAQFHSAAYLDHIPSRLDPRHVTSRSSAFAAIFNLSLLLLLLLL